MRILEDREPLLSLQGQGQPLLVEVELVECVAAAPVFGQHNVELLRDILWYDESMISELKKANAISE